MPQDVLLGRNIMLLRGEPRPAPEERLRGLRHLLLVGAVSLEERIADGILRGGLGDRAQKCETATLAVDTVGEPGRSRPGRRLCDGSQQAKPTSFKPARRSEPQWQRGARARGRLGGEETANQSRVLSWRTLSLITRCLSRGHQSSQIIPRMPLVRTRKLASVRTRAPEGSEGGGLDSQAGTDPQY